MLKKYPVYYLLQIPVWIFLYAIVVELGLIVDSLLFSNMAEEGAKRTPYLGIAIFVLASIGLIFLIIRSIVTFVRVWIERAKKKKAANMAMLAAQEDTK
ncbi:MAG: hypothetical protein J5546_04095 [Lachnospiraceae bacterium]|nr:hypothetical protein [Lachnospiraceae bacterium]